MPLLSHSEIRLSISETNRKITDSLRAIHSTCSQSKTAIIESRELLVKVTEQLKRRSPVHV